MATIDLLDFDTQSVKPSRDRPPLKNALIATIKNPTEDSIANW